MSLMTPRGLKIRLPLPFAFALLARLWQKDRHTDAFRVLKTCEAIDDIPSVMSVLAGLLVVLPASNAAGLWVAGSMIVGRLVGAILTRSGRFDVLRACGLVFFGRVRSWTPNVVSFLIGCSVLAAIALLRGWRMTAYWIVGYLLASCADGLLEFVWCFRANRAVGYPLTASETNFFHAYRLHADEIGVTRNLVLSESEQEELPWRECFLDYAVKWPEAVARFPDQGEVAEAIGTQLSATPVGTPSDPFKDHGS